VRVQAIAAIVPERYLANRIEFLSYPLRDGRQAQYIELGSSACSRWAPPVQDECVPDDADMVIH
jgi:hypothetical protein